MSQGFLLDTSVISALAPDKPPLPEPFGAWLFREADLLFLPTIVCTEIEEGAAKLRRSGGLARADRLSDWLDGLLAIDGDRVLAFNAPSARKAGSLSDAARAAGRHPGFADVTIAAIADVRELVILTRNLRHFHALGAPAVDPFLTPIA